MTAPFVPSEEGSVSNGDGVTRLPDAYGWARQQAITHLRQYARQGILEASYLVDRDTGEIIDFVEATEDHPTLVNHDESHIIGHLNVANIHAHLDDLPPGADDWSQLVASWQLQELHVIGATILYSLIKPPGWAAPVYRQSDFLVFQSHLLMVQRRSGYSHRRFLDLPLDAQASILHDTNARMASRYTILYRREVLI